MSHAPILIVDDHPLFRDALKVAVESLGLERDLVTASSLKEAQDAVSQGSISLALLDIHLDDCDGFKGLLSLKQLAPDTPILICSASDEQGVVGRALGLGAAGFLPKSASLSEICDGIKAVMHGEVYAPHGYDPSDDSASDADSTEKKLQSLTPAQMRVLAGVADGLLNKQIAFDMGISEATVKAHMTAIFRKLGVTNRTQVVLLAQNLAVANPAEREAQPAGQGHTPT